LPTEKCFACAAKNEKKFTHAARSEVTAIARGEKGQPNFFA